MNQTFNATPVMTSSLAVNVLLNMLGSGLITVKRLGAPFTESHYMLTDLVDSQEPSKVGQFIILSPEDVDTTHKPMASEGDSRLLLIGTQSGRLVMAFDLPEEEIQSKLIPMLSNGFPLMRSFTPPSQVMTNMAPPTQQWNNPAGLNPIPLQGMNTLHNLNNVLNMISYNPGIVQVKKSGEIMSKKKGAIGKVHLILRNTSLNFHQVVEKFLSETFEATYLNSWSAEYRDVVVAQIVGVYVSNMVGNNGIMSISNPCPFTDDAGIENVLGKTAIITINGNNISYVLEP